MKKLLFSLLTLLSCTPIKAHPSGGLVCDSKGNLYYSDLERVWKLEPSGRKTVAVPNVHTHDLYMDGNDNLYGQTSTYSGEATNKYYHSVWRLTKHGKLETVVPNKEGFYIENFSFTQDNAGNMYWVKHDGKKTEFMKTTGKGATTKIADGAFEKVQWIRVINSSIYYVNHGGIYRLDDKGNVKPVALNIGRKSNAHNSIYNLWSDRAGNVYVANASKQCVQRIDRLGTIKTVYRSSGTWFPTGGVFTAFGKMAVLEWNAKNEIRIMRVSNLP